jgi:AAA15 family ATPase/GTPase
MENNIEELEIRNFKSIDKLIYKPKRVNVFIGKPNVGKSNILEALSLLSSSIVFNGANDFINDNLFIRYSQLNNLFYNNDIHRLIAVHTDKGGVNFSFSNNIFKLLTYNNDVYYKEFIKNLLRNQKRVNAISVSDEEYKKFYDNLKQKIDFSYQFKPSINPFVGHYNYEGVCLESWRMKDFFQESGANIIKRYSYKDIDTYDGRYGSTLNEPFGDNLLSALTYNPDIAEEVASFLKEQELDLVFDESLRKIIIQKRKGRVVYQIPYSNVADTFKRIFFYLTAIETNKDSVLLFEEPEVHSYPPYIKMLADRIILNDENQYFISTHSPYMLNTLIDGLDDTELNVVLTYYEDYQTKIKILSAEELAEIQEWKTDIFFNIDKFTNQLQEK